MANEPGGDQRKRAKERQGEQRIAGWQRALRWAAWLTFLGAAAYHSDRVSFGGLEFLTLFIAIGVSIWCMAKPLGGPKVDIDKPSDARGTFVSRVSWGLVLLGTVLTIGGVGATGAIVYDVSTGRATVRDVLHDMAIFVEGWIAERITGYTYDAELEKTHAYALFVLVIPGLLLLAYNLIPLFRRGREFRVEPDGSISVRDRNGFTPILEYEYSAVSADGTTIRYTPSHDGTREIVLPQARVFCRENNARLERDVSGQLIGERLVQRGFRVDDVDVNHGHFRAQRGV